MTLLFSAEVRLGSQPQDDRYCELARHLGIEVPLESRHLEPVLGVIQKMIVDAERVEIDVVVFGGAAERSEDAFIGFGAGA